MVVVCSGGGGGGGGGGGPPLPMEYGVCRFVCLCGGGGGGGGGGAMYAALYIWYAAPLLQQLYSLSCGRVTLVLDPCTWPN